MKRKYKANRQVKLGANVFEDTYKSTSEDIIGIWGKYGQGPRSDNPYSKTLVCDSCIQAYQQYNEREQFLQYKVRYRFLYFIWLWLWFFTYTKTSPYRVWQRLLIRLKWLLFECYYRSPKTPLKDHIKNHHKNHLRNHQGYPLDKPHEMTLNKSSLNAKPHWPTKV